MINNYLEIAINRCLGRWNLSRNAIEWLRKHGATEEDFKNWKTYRDRHNPILIECVKKLGPETSRYSSNCGYDGCIEIFTLVNENTYFIQDWDGMERVYTMTTCPWITAPYSYSYEYPPEGEDNERISS